jgi:hypothetical protein
MRSVWPLLQQVGFTSGNNSAPLSSAAQALAAPNLGKNRNQDYPSRRSRGFVMLALFFWRFFFFSRPCQALIFSGGVL